MPELPEVETVKESLKNKVLHKKIVGIHIYYDKIVATPISFFTKNCMNKEIVDIKRRGKWLLFDLGDFYLLSHLRMEGKYFIRGEEEAILKHEHVCFVFSDHSTLRYLDTRKFGRMYLIEKNNIEKVKPLKDLGKEPFDESLTVLYLKDKLKGKHVPIKTSLLNQHIIAGIGNIYVDEILFLSGIHPLRPSMELNEKELLKILENTKIVLEKAIGLGGTTIRTYTSSEGVHGKFQNELFIHGKDKEKCVHCGNPIHKIVVGGRGTYICDICQK